MIAKRRWLALGLAAIAGLSQACGMNAIHDYGFTVQGLVVDAAGRPLPGATVKTLGRPTVTDGHGCFVLFDLVESKKFLMPFSVDGTGAKSFAGSLDAPGELRVRVVLADTTSDARTVVDTSPAPDALMSCEPPRISPWVKGATAAMVGTTRISALRELPSHLGEYPCRNGLLESPVVIAALQELLASSYEDYLDDIQLAGCGPVMKQGSWIVMARSRPFSESWRSSVFLVDPQTGHAYLFWHRAYWDSNAAYGSQPIPRDVATIIVDELTLQVGHVYKISWGDGGVQFEQRSADGAARHP